MMQASDHGHLDDFALVGALRRSGLRCIFLQGKVSPAPVVVGEIVSQHATQVRFVQHHYVVEALAAASSDEAFDIVLPRRPWRDLHLLDPQGVHPAREHRAGGVGLVLVSETAGPRARINR